MTSENTELFPYALSYMRVWLAKNADKADWDGLVSHDRVDNSIRVFLMRETNEALYWFARNFAPARFTSRRRIRYALKTTLPIAVTSIRKSLQAALVGGSDGNVGMPT